MKVNNNTTTITQQINNNDVIKNNEGTKMSTQIKAQFGTLAVYEDGETVDLVSIGLVEYDPYRE